jgi:hypothetical protein
MLFPCGQHTSKGGGRDAEKKTTGVSRLGEMGRNPAKREAQHKGEGGALCIHVVDA